jgi:hypothetical protein
VLTVFLWRNLRERDHFESRCKWEDNIEMDLPEAGRRHGLD